MRLQKFISRSGAASRREAERLIAGGRVRVNGAVVREMGVTVDPTADRVEVDGKRLTLDPPRWILLHKPPGVLTTAHDPGGGRTVYDLLPEDSDDLRYVGRLDRDTEGLLLLTNQGDLLHRLTHPSYEVEREYWAQVEGAPDSGVLDRLTRGVELQDGPARATRAWRQKGGAADELRLVLTEGRKREVRRLLAAVGHPVVRLRRERYGPVALGALPAGAWRDLTPGEVDQIKKSVG